MLGWLTDPFSSPLAQRALVEVLILAVACGPLGVWVLLYRDAYAAESMSHGDAPGLVVAALTGAPLVLGAARACSSRRSGSRWWRARRGSARTPGWRSWCPRCSASAPCSRSPRRRRRGCRAAVRRPARRRRDGPAGGGRARPGVVGACSRGTARSRSSASTAARHGAGRPPLRWELALLAMLGITTVAAVQGLGNLLLVALILAPGAAALQPRRRLPLALALAAGLAALSGSPA